MMLSRFDLRPLPALSTIMAHHPRPSVRRFSMRRASLFVFALLLGSVSSVRAADPPDFKPDPLSVKRSGAGYRYPQAGWIVLHIEGEPYERGYQHGQLLAPEIAGYLKC